MTKLDRDAEFHADQGFDAFEAFDAFEHGSADNRTLAASHVAAGLGAHEVFDAYQHGFPNDRAFSSWHLTAGLGAVASLASAGLVWWAMATVSGWHLPSPSAEQALASATEPAGAPPASGPTTVVSKSDRASAMRSEPLDLKFSGWEADLDRTAKTFVLPEEFAGDQAKMFWPRPSEWRAVQSEATAAPPSPAANVAPPAADQAAETDPPSLPARTFAPHRRIASSERERDPPRSASQPRTTSPKLHKEFARGTYTEKVVEQGDAGEVKYRYVHRACTPPHMVDVCYMPAESRRSIVVQRY